MRRMPTIIAAGLATLALVAASSAPVVAMAATADGGGTVTATTTAGPSDATTLTPARPTHKAVVKYRTKARVRLAAFNATADALGYRIYRLGKIASLVASAGGDVTQVRQELATARSYLVESRAQAKLAAADLRLVPYFEERAVAKARANAEFKTARETRYSARDWKRTAATDLWTIIDQMGMTSEYPAADFT